MFHDRKKEMKGDKEKRKTEKCMINRENKGRIRRILKRRERTLKK